MSAAVLPLELDLLVSILSSLCYFTDFSKEVAIFCVCQIREYSEINHSP